MEPRRAEEGAAQRAHGGANVSLHGRVFRQLERAEIVRASQVFLADAVQDGAALPVAAQQIQDGEGDGREKPVGVGEVDRGDDGFALPAGGDLGRRRVRCFIDTDRERRRRAGGEAVMHGQRHRVVTGLVG